MEATKNTEAIILGRQPYREADALVTAYTSGFGKQVLVARGAKKQGSKLSGHLEPISRADIMIISGRGFDYIGSVITADAYQGIRGDLNKLFFAGRAIRIFDHLVKEGQTDERLFFLLSKWLEMVDGYCDQEFTKEIGELFLIFFIWRLLTHSGYRPELQRCLVCQREVCPGHNYFDLAGGGLVEHDCLANGASTPGNGMLALSDSAINLLRLVLEDRTTSALNLKIPKKIIKELTSLTDKFLRYNFDFV